jgi:CheY-like chemotaxis protein
MSAHILVIEDEPETAAFLTQILERLGYEVTVAHNGEDALDQIHPRLPNLALVDLVMPGIGGWELVRRIRQDRSIQQVPIPSHRGRADRRACRHAVQTVRAGRDPADPRGAGPPP